MSKIRFNWELNFGHIVTVVGLFLTVGLPVMVFGVNREADFRIIQRDVKRIDDTLSRVVDNQNIALRAFEGTQALLANHLQDVRTGKGVK